MNIKTRIEKLENQTANQADGFCICIQNHFTAQINSVYDNVPIESTPLPDGDFCGKCKKRVNPVDTKTIETLVKIYGEVETI